MELLALIGSDIKINLAGILKAKKIKRPNTSYNGRRKSKETKTYSNYKSILNMKSSK